MLNQQAQAHYQNAADLALAWRKLIDRGADPVVMANACIALATESYRRCGISDEQSPEVARAAMLMYIYDHPKPSKSSCTTATNEC